MWVYLSCKCITLWHEPTQAICAKAYGSTHTHTHTHTQTRRHTYRDREYCLKYIIYKKVSYREYLKGTGHLHFKFQD